MEAETGYAVPMRGNRKYPWDRMRVGSSFLVEDAKIKSMRSQASRAGKAYNRSFRVAEVDGGVRCWRTA